MSTSDQSNKGPSGPAPWGSDPIRGLNYDYLDIDSPPAIEPKAVVPQKTQFNSAQAEDFYRKVRGKIVKWAEGTGANQEVTQYILLLPDIMALFVRLMADPRVSSALKMEIAAASAYVISPIDLMPELALGPAGLIDDAIIGVIAMNRVVKAMGQVGEDVLRQHWDGREDILVVMETLLKRADGFVTGPVWNGIKQFMKDVTTPAEAPPANVVEGKARPTDNTPLR